MNFLEQMKLQALRRFEDESRTYSSGLNDAALALEAMVAHFADGIVLIEGEHGGDPLLRMQYVNPAFCSMSGYQPEALVGRSFSLLFSHESADETKNAVSEFLKSGTSGQIEALCRRHDGSQFLASIRLLPVGDGAGQPSKWFFEIRDITSQHAEVDLTNRLAQAESENKRLEAELGEARSHEAKLELGTIHDPVTGSVSRPYFLERLSETLSHAREERIVQGHVLCVGFDEFEKLRSEMDHSTSDHILVEVAHRLRRSLPRGCPIARLHSAEFLVLLEGVDSMTAFETANILIRFFTDRIDILGRSIAMPPSIGLCTVDPTQKDAEQIMRDAEAAMERARRQGGARAVWYEEATNVRSIALARTKSELERALQEGQIEVYYLPQLNVQTTPPKLCAVEALVRWNHPKLGLLAPGRFLSIAEKFGLIVPLGLHVMRTACRQMKAWQSNIMFPDISLILNVSADQLMHPNFFSDFVDILAETEVDAHVVKLDVPEDIFVQINTAVFDVLQRLRQLGVGIVLDQWGGSKTSIVQLETYPIDGIKLDRSLVNNFERNASQVELAKLIISYARALGLAPSATGVSNAFEGNALQRCGCHVLQGFLYSAPVSAAGITKLLDQGTRTLLHA